MVPLTLLVPGGGDDDDQVEAAVKVTAALGCCSVVPRHVGEAGFADKHSSEPGKRGDAQTMLK